MPPKRRRRFHGLYSHSSKPKVLPMNDQSASSNERRMRGNDDLSVKLSTIRIWMHEKDIGKLTRVLWAGQGNRLRQQASTNGKVKRFLAAVPYVMNSIKDVHQAVIDNNLENLQSNLEPPVPPSLVTCRDANGLNLIHKAAGLGHATILEYLITTWPDGVHETDITGKTPLHWAASAKNNMRCYTLLTQAGCDEEAVDYKMKTPSFYRHKPHEIERTFLMYIPEAPRVSPHVATDWEALSDDSGDGKKLDIKIPEMNGFGRHSNAESNENASETEMAEAASAHEDEAQSVAENTKPVDDQDQTNEKTVEDETEIKSEDGHKEEQTNEKTEENAEDGEQQKTEEPNEDEEMQNKEENEEPQDEEPQAEAGNEENSSNGEENNEVDDKADIENETEANIVSVQELPTEPSPKVNADDMYNKGNNEEKPNDEQKDGEGSPTSSMAIEGFVQGSAEDNTLQSQTAAYVDEETRIRNILTTGNMEHLAEIVLNGEGRKLLDIGSTENPEVEAFLRNVPSYMEKIRRVHESARSGSLLNLQQDLDRRKFAVAKDEISPNGATPLHVAVIFGNSDIVRYLAARFPETTAMTDNDGRTALHYAAVIQDNGHFYNVLLQLGANPNTADKMGHTPEDYLAKKELADILNYTQLLKWFEAEGLEEQLLSDQGRLENQNIQENPLFKTEQGKYLADNLADPLIKALTQVAQKRPSDPLQYLANYLQSYVTSRHTNGRTITQAAVHSDGGHTNSTALASSHHSTPQEAQMQRQTTHMNGHTNFDTADDIEEYDRQQIEDDNGNDSDVPIPSSWTERDEHGQSVIHFACARPHRKDGLIFLIEDSKTDISWRDELYRTARDVALQANQLGNAQQIDRYMMSLAIVGDVKPFEHLAISGYDHIIDVMDENDNPIIKVVEDRGLNELAEYLKTIRPLEELREELHQMIRDNNVGRVEEIVEGPNGKWLIKARNYYGRTALHIAILKESVEIVEHFVNLCPEALRIGDNLERTPLHYAMGTNIIESVSRILIQNGAKRTQKDLKGRQPSYYFMNKADILRLQEEEDESR